MRETLKKTSLKSNKGITLIALVITIIVLLLLAGVSISMLSGENGILNKATSVEKTTKVAEEGENVKLAVLTALMEGNGEIITSEALQVLKDELKKVGCTNADDIDSLPATAIMEHNSYLINKFGNISEPDAQSDIETDVSKLTVPVSKKTIYKDETSVNTTNKTVVIPEGFKVSSIGNEQKIDTGVVVIAPDESEFVWVPVDDINSMVMCQGSKDNTGENDCKITLSEDKLVCETHPNNDICGKLYATELGEVFNKGLNNQTYNATEGLRESALLTDTNAGDCAAGNRGLGLIRYYTGMTEEKFNDSEVIEEWTKNLQSEFEQMAKSVYANKGFYVGRYETSLDTNNEAQSRAKQTPAQARKTINGEYLRWYGLYKIEKDYNKKVVSEKTLENIVGSTMIWGSQYDQMMLWMIANGLEVDKPLKDNPNLNGATKNTSFVTTGKDGDMDKLNNVYDLLGCNFEWTLEANGDHCRVIRGGDDRDASSYAASCRYDYYPSDNTSYHSSRITLYIK